MAASYAFETSEMPEESIELFRLRYLRFYILNKADHNQYESLVERQQN